MDADLDALLADAAAEWASRARSEERLLRQAAEEGATFLGTLVDLAERADPITVRTRTGRAHRGRLVAVGRDFIVVRELQRAPVFVAVDAIASVRAPGRSRPDTAGDRVAPLDASFSAVLAALGGRRPRVQIGVEGEETPALGELRAVGRDVVTLRLEAASRPTVYVPVTVVSEVVLLDL